METAIVVRHAESEFSVRGTVNGDPAVAGGALTETGRGQARALARRLAPATIDLCVITQFRRTQETAQIALAGRQVPLLVVAELNDIGFGSFEGGTLADYRTWAHAHGPAADCPGGGESRAHAAHRFARGFRAVARRPERRIFVVTHGLPIRYLLGALAGRGPAAMVEPVAYAQGHHVDRADLERAAERLEAWAAEPVFA